MAPPGQHESPRRAPGAPKNALGGASTVTETTDAVVDGAPATVVFDVARSRSEDVSRRLLAATRSEREAYFAGREDGFVDGERVGFARGYKACDDEISRLQVEAHKIVNSLAKLPERHRLDEEVDQ